MSTATEVRRYTVYEYLAMEPEGEVRHEFIDGEIVSMVGSSVQHNIIVMNLGAAIHQHLRGTPCRVMSNDMKVLITEVNCAYYPDVVVSCSELREMIDRYTETQPRLIVEVLSPSTADTDREQKRLHYQQLNSLQDYVLVAQNERQVEVYSRQRDGDWVLSTYGIGDTVVLPSIDLQMPIAAVYEDVTLASDGT